MIGRAHRFHGYGSLRGVYQRGRTARTPMVSLRYATRGPDRAYRIAVVVSRKTSKSAVVRNRIRRRIYEAVRRVEEKVRPGTDLVFTVWSDQVAEIEPAKLRAVIDELLEKAADPGAGRA